jgi:ankyrin repeat protein
MYQKRGRMTRGKRTMRKRTRTKRRMRVLRGGATTALYQAAKAGDLDRVVDLVYADIHNIDAAQVAPDNNGMSIMTPLEVAAKNGHLLVVEFLVKHGANIHGRDESSGEPLITLAVKSGNFALVNYLLSLGLDINQRSLNALQRTPIFYATDEMIPFLVKKGADLDVVDGLGRVARNSPRIRSALIQMNMLKNIPEASTIRDIPVNTDSKIIMYKYFGGRR